MNNHNEDLQPPIVGHSILDFGTLPKGGKVTWEELITNTNEQRLLWCGDTGETSWLVLNPNAGSLKPGEQQRVKITAITDTLEVGDHNATLFFTWEGDDYSVGTEVNATLGVDQKSPLAVGLSFSLFSESSKTLPLAITNRFDQIVGWTADTGGSSWLTLDRYKGTLKPHEQQTIYVTANSSTLKIGNYAATLRFVPKAEDIELAEKGETKSKSVKLPVELHVQSFFKPFSDSGPKIPLLSQNSFDFKEKTVTSQNLVITNQETRTKTTNRVQWTITGGRVSWVTLNPSSGIFEGPNDSATVEVKINTNTLTPSNSTDLLVTVAFIDPPLSANESSSAPPIPVTFSP